MKRPTLIRHIPIKKYPKYPVNVIPQSTFPKALKATGNTIVITRAIKYRHTAAKNFPVTILVTFIGTEYNSWSVFCLLSSAKSRIVDEKENSVYTINVSGEQGTDIREIIFASFAQAEIPVLMLKPVSDSLEDAFINVVNGAYDEVITESNEEIEEVEIIEESVEVLSDEEVDE